MKTAERVLATSLELFNYHGESSVTSVDIANEMDISPGNLYYHFKGKELIVDALFDIHIHQFERLLDVRNIDALTLEEYFYYLYLLLEQIHLYRFLYRSPMDLMEKYPKVAKNLVRLVKLLEAKLESVLTLAQQREFLTLSDNELKSLVEMMSLTIIQSSQYYQLKGDVDDGHQIYSTLALLLALLSPRMRVPVENLAELQQQLSLHGFTRGNT